jgi:hypothetical protein
MVGKSSDQGAKVIGRVAPREGDAAIRAALAQHGDDGSKPRHTLFYFYDGDQDGLREAASAKGFSVTPVKSGSGSVLEATISVDEASFEPINQQMSAWAEQFGAEYDGWETAVEA